jgi:hypothetical protein
MKRIGLIDLQPLIAACAYFKWLNGSHDTTQNWFEARTEVIAMLSGEQL